jgi:hypothetical protein
LGHPENDLGRIISAQFSSHVLNSHKISKLAREKGPDALHFIQMS